MLAIIRVGHIAVLALLIAPQLALQVRPLEQDVRPHVHPPALDLLPRMLQPATHTATVRDHRLPISLAQPLYTHRQPVIALTMLPPSSDAHLLTLCSRLSRSWLSALLSCTDMGTMDEDVAGDRRPLAAASFSTCSFSRRFTVSKPRRIPPTSA